MANSTLEALRTVGDWVAGAVTVLSLVKVLPALAAGLAMLWYSVNLYEKTTGKPFSESKLAKFLRRDKP